MNLKREHKFFISAGVLLFIAIERFYAASSGYSDYASEMSFRKIPDFRPPWTFTYSLFAAIICLIAGTLIEYQALPKTMENVGRRVVRGISIAFMGSALLFHDSIATVATLTSLGAIFFYTTLNSDQTNSPKDDSLTPPESSSR